MPRIAMSIVYRSNKNNHIVSKRFAMKHPDKVTGKAAHPSKKQAARAARTA
jgi:hypothetical protein